MLRHWKSEESTEVEETSAEEDRDWNGDSDADWTIESGVALRFLEEVCALWWPLTEDLVGITGLCVLVLDELILVNVRDHGWDTG